MTEETNNGRKTKRLTELWDAYTNRAELPPEATPKEVFFKVVGTLFDERETMRRKLGRRSQALQKARDQLAALGHPVHTHEKTEQRECDHTGGHVVKYDHIQCSDCGAVKTGVSGWKDYAQRKWFRSHSEARFYDTHGCLPQKLSEEV